MKNITLIVPVYQVEAYLEECLDSIVAQTYRDFRCILVDDGSKDRSADIIKKYTQKYPQIFSDVRQENRGLSGARNTGIEMLDTEYVAFLDSDDIACPDFLKTLYQTAVEHRADIVECGFTKFYENGDTQVVAPKLKGCSEVAADPDCICHFTLTAWNKLYRSSLFTQTGVRYPEGLIYEDTATTPLLLARSKTVCSIDAPLIKYRQRDGSIMSRTDKRVFDLYKLAQIIERDSALARYPEQRDAHVIFRMQALIMKLCKMHGTNEEIRNAYRYLAQWNDNWYQNRIWRDLSKGYLKTRIFKRIFVSQSIWILRIIAGKRKQ